ncbi:MAG: hypothetical protein WCT05_10785 [Lentisphaeria bacterium]
MSLTVSKKIVCRNFPLSRIQCGAMLGNGNLGLLIWGEENILNLSFGSASLWDHRGGFHWSEKQNFAAIREILEGKDRQALGSLFTSEKTEPVARPTLVPLGRIVLKLPESCKLLRYEQILANGTTKVFYSDLQQEKCLEFRIGMQEDVLLCRGLAKEMYVELSSAWWLTRNRAQKECLPDAECNTLEKRGFVQPLLKIEHEYSMFLQEMPADPSYSLAYERRSSNLVFAFARGCKNLEEVRKTLSVLFRPIWNNSARWWKAYWKDMPGVSCGDSEVGQLYWEGLYKYGCMTNPAGVPAGLQGPWIEDDRFPPWSGDYHFNINVQMCYSPGFKAGKFTHLKHLFDMILSWRNRLRQNAEKFTGRTDGYMLPHAVDDRGVCMGNFWTGMIDHACAAWTAMLMFDYCDYSSDLEFLRSEGMDFMLGVLRVFEAIMQRNQDGSLCLPVGVSPEYHGAEFDAWGKNPSFQLAAIHRLAQNILRASEWLALEPDAFALEVIKQLPAASISGAGDKACIALWDGLELGESHRHHSHLAGLVPFATIDPSTDSWQQCIGNTIQQWTALGMGQWSGWSIPWASQIRTRLGHGDMAVFLMKYWKACFSNTGGGSLHDAAFKGPSIFAQIRGEIMQMDGIMGCVTAIQDLFLYSQCGILYVFRGLPQDCEKAEFSKLRAPGGFILSGKYQRGEPISLRITATRDAELRIQVKDAKTVCSRKLNRGETIDLRIFKSCVLNYSGRGA